MISLNLERDVSITSHGISVPGKLRIFRLYQVKGNRWACEWSLEPIVSVKSRMFGDDAIHALSNCIRLLHQLIIRLKEDGESDVWWQYEGDACLLGGAYPDNEVR